VLLNAGFLLKSKTTCARSGSYMSGRTAYWPDTSG